MRFTQIIALPVFMLAIGGNAYAGAIPTNIGTINNIAGPANQAAGDYSFDNRGLAVSFTGTQATGFTLVASAANAFSFNGSGSTVTNVLNGSYNLTASFTGAGNFKSGLLTIQGAIGNVVTPSGTVAGAGSATSPALLFEADLTSVGVNTAQSSIGFDTDWTKYTTAWANNPIFTAGSNGDSVYLFESLSGHDGLTPIVQMLAGLRTLTAYTDASSAISLAAVPVPMPVVLFGTGLTALLGLGRKRQTA